MTLYGIDISNNNGANLSMAEVKSEGFAWVEAKVSEGNYYRDYTWAKYRDDASAVGLPIIGYHYAIASCSPESQAATFVANGGGDKVMIDFENNSGNIGDFWALVNAFNSVGVEVVASYIPEWYWSGAMGGGDLSRVPGLIASAYPGGSGAAITIYDADGADTGHGWSGYGGGKPVIWQFTDHAQVDGTTVDANAFIGSNDELIALLGGAVALSQDDINSITAAVTASVTKWLADFVVGYVGPIGSDVKDIREQLTGGRDSIRSADGTVDVAKSFPTLSQNGWRTLNDLVAALAAKQGVVGASDINPTAVNPNA